MPESLVVVNLSNLPESHKSNGNTYGSIDDARQQQISKFIKPQDNENNTREQGKEKHTLTILGEVNET